MKHWRLLILVFVLAAFFTAVWIWWQRPQRVEMATYVPAETLVYLEANDLPQVLVALTATDAWRELAPVYKIEKDYGNFGWFSRILASANLGSTETVVFGRSQIAVALINIGAKEGAENSLKIRPVYAVVIETKSSRAPAPFVEKQVGDFAKKQLGEIRVEKKNADDAAWTIYRSTTDERNLFAAVAGTTAIIGNDQSAVQACLDTKNGKRKNLADDENLLKMRANVESETAFAFGFITAEGVKQLSHVGAILVAGQMAEEPQAMSLLAQSLPPFLQKTVNSIGWSARFNAGRIEDRYYVQMPADLVSRLREPLAIGEQKFSRAGDFLPLQTRTVTIYNLKNAGAAWRGVVFAIMTRLDTVSAAAFSQMTNSLLAPYGVKNATEFLDATKGEIVTARIPSVETNSKVAIVSAHNADKMRQNLEKPAQAVEDKFLFGEAVDQCLRARESKETLAETVYWKNFNASPNIAFIRTMAADGDTPPSFVALFAKDENKNNAPLGNSPDWIWTTSETRLMREGFDRRTVSPFGLIGTLATSFAEK